MGDEITCTYVTYSHSLVRDQAGRYMRMDIREEDGTRTYIMARDDVSIFLYLSLFLLLSHALYLFLS